jgi:hypothetical protein
MHCLDMEGADVVRILVRRGHEAGVHVHEAAVIL